MLGVNEHVCVSSLKTHKAPGSGSFHLTDRIMEAHRDTAMLSQSTEPVCGGEGQTVPRRSVGTGCISTTIFRMINLVKLEPRRMRR